MSNDLVLWDSPNGVEMPKNATVETAMPFNIKLNKIEVNKIEVTYGSEFYDMSSEYIWIRSINLLRQKVLSLGKEFVLEMLGRTDLNSVENLQEFDVIYLAAELGFINNIGKIKLLQANDLIKYYSSREAEEEMDKSSADIIIITCIKYILGQESSQLKLEYNNFRETLKLRIINESDETYDTLINSPYFYRRTTVRTLLNLVKTCSSAELQNVSVNIQVIIPGIWDTLLSDDRYPIGISYAEAVNSGNRKVSSILKSLLLKVKGFDYVPENLRSTTFINSARNLISVHYSINNFYNEPEAIKNLASLGTIIPSPAIGVCLTAIIHVKLGNGYGVSRSAQPIADELLKSMYEDKWKYFLEKVLIGDELILLKLISPNRDVKARWCDIVITYELNKIDFDNPLIKRMISASMINDYSTITSISKSIYDKLTDPNKIIDK